MFAIQAHFMHASDIYNLILGNAYSNNNKNNNKKNQRSWNC